MDTKPEKIETLLLQLNSDQLHRIFRVLLPQIPEFFEERSNTSIKYIINNLPTKDIGPLHDQLSGKTVQRIFDALDIVAIGLFIQNLPDQNIKILIDNLREDEGEDGRYIRMIYKSENKVGANVMQKVIKMLEIGQINFFLESLKNSSPACEFFADYLEGNTKLIFKFFDNMYEQNLIEFFGALTQKQKVIVFDLLIEHRIETLFGCLTASSARSLIEMLEQGEIQTLFTKLNSKQTVIMFDYLDETGILRVYNSLDDVGIPMLLHDLEGRQVERLLKNLSQEQICRLERHYNSLQVSV